MARNGQNAPVTVRMYNVGFGDCFLLFLPTTEGTRTVLVDCGVHIGGVANSIASVSNDVIATVTKDGTARIDVVVATHRHFDHISGFDRKVWRDVEVGEVWMPWTENPADAKATALRKAQNRLATLLAKRHPSVATREGWLALNSLSNAGAEATLRTGFAGAPMRRYLPDVEREKRTFTTPTLPGVVVHALGPSHDKAAIALLDPPVGKYFPLGFAAYEGDHEAAASAEPLFRAGLTMTPTEYQLRFPELAESTPQSALQELATDNDLGAAEALEDAINGTSLVLVLEVANHRILLAGDAEWGTWQEVLSDEGWCDLLRRTSLFKVGHHGSYNGTPRPFVDDLLPDDALSLVSLRHVKRWPSIPRKSLLDALDAKSRTLIRTDDLAANAAAFRRNGDLWVEVDLDPASESSIP